MITASELAKTLGISRQRVHQYVKAGKLDGCFSGDGSLRRFDVAKSAAALGKRLDPGQLMGNGAATKAALSKIQKGDTPEAAPLIEMGLNSEKGPEPTTGPEPDSYEAWRIEKAKEETRRLRRINAESEGRYVLADEAARATKRLLAQEIAQFETALRNGSRMVADQLGVDFKTVRQLMAEAWRGHRADRSEALDELAGGAEPTDAELAEDI
jgi:hypothetical protein